MWLSLTLNTYPVIGYKPLQDPPVASLIRAEILLVYLDNLYHQTGVGRSNDIIASDSMATLYSTSTVSPFDTHHNLVSRSTCVGKQTYN